jgi:hypothetical protein
MPQWKCIVEEIQVFKKYFLIVLYNSSYLVWDYILRINPTQSFQPGFFLKDIL